MTYLDGRHVGEDGLGGLGGCLSKAVASFQEKGVKEWNAPGTPGHLRP